MKLQFKQVLPVLLGVLLLAGCGPGATGGAATATTVALTRVPVPTSGPTMGAATATSGPSLTSLPAEPTRLVASTETPGTASVVITVTAFTVWQDFMPGTNPGGPPLYATVEFNAENSGTAVVQEVVATHLQIRRASSEVLLDTGLTGGAVNAGAGPVAGLPPGQTSHHSYRTTATDVSPTLSENEAVMATLTVRVNGVEQMLPVPATRVQFTH